MKSQFKQPVSRRFFRSFMAMMAAMTSFVFPAISLNASATGAISAPGDSVYQESISSLPKYTEVFFGKEDKTWYVTGVEDGALVLFCHGNFGTSAFDDTPPYTYDYGGNTLDTAIQALYASENEHFTSEEIAQMKDVSISFPADDTHPKTGIQTSITRKMYAASAKFTSDTEYSKDTILVGSGVGSIEVEVSVSRLNPENTGSYFYLRTTPHNDPSYMFYFPDVHVIQFYNTPTEVCVTTIQGCTAFLDCPASIVPALHLDLTSALFASSAKPATASTASSLDSNGVMTIRYDGSSKITSSAAAGSSSSITVTNPTAGEFLVVQWKDESGTDRVQSVALRAGESTYGSSDGLPTLTSDCRIWIEKKDSTTNLVYAKKVTPPTKNPGPAAPSGLTGVSPTAGGIEDGRILGTTEEMEYSTSSDFTDAHPCSASETTGLAAGTYYVRIKETAATCAGAAATVIISTAEVHPENNNGNTSNTSNTGNTSGGNRNTSCYSIKKTKTGCGTLLSNMNFAIAGNAVTLSVAPAPGWTLDSLTAKDAKGNTVTLTEGTDGTCTFKMPAANVTVSAVFANPTAQPSAEDTDQGTAEVAAQDSICDRFTDVDLTAWYHPGVHFCLEKGYMNGVETTLFAPNGTLSRGMIVTMLWRMQGSPVADGSLTFSDVASDQWYTEAVRWAQSAGVVRGYDETTFGPNDNVTREQLAAILYRIAESRGEGFTGASMFPFNPVDEASISDWAQESMRWCSMKNILKGDDTGALRPTGDSTRAEAANMLQRFCEAIAE